MGVYYSIVCDELKQVIYPEEINNLSPKEYHIAEPDSPFGQIIINFLNDKWSGKNIRLTDDTNSLHEEYLSVTLQAIEAYNSKYETRHKFTPIGGE